MAKELPYFKFEPAEYLTKDISFCSLQAQGLFINICSYYWQRNCKLTKEQLLKRLNHEAELNELISEGVIDLNGSDIVIKFLDIQLVDVGQMSRKNSVNGSKGGRPKKPTKNPNETQTKAKLNPNESQTKGIREDKIRLDNTSTDVDDVFKFSSPTDEGVFHNIDLLKTQYLENTKLIKAVCDNLANRLTSETISDRLEAFNSHLKQQDEFAKTKNDYAKHFRMWHKKTVDLVPQKLTAGGLKVGDMLRGMRIKFFKDDGTPVFEGNTKVATK